MLQWLRYWSVIWRARVSVGTAVGRVTPSPVGWCCSVSECGDLFEAGMELVPQEKGWVRGTRPASVRAPGWGCGGRRQKSVGRPLAAAMPRSGKPVVETVDFALPSGGVLGG